MQNQHQDRGTFLYAQDSLMVMWNLQVAPSIKGGYFRHITRHLSLNIVEFLRGR